MGKESGRVAYVEEKTRKLESREMEITQLFL
jgi:hypothetical protein